MLTLSAGFQISHHCFRDDVNQMCQNEKKRTCGACSACSKHCLCSLNMQIPNGPPYRRRRQYGAWVQETTTTTTTTTPQTNDFIGWMRKNNRAARAARFLVQFLDVVCQTRTRNFQICVSDDNASPQQLIFHSLRLHEYHSCQTS